LPGVAALIALVFAYQQINSTNAQLQIAQQGQITDRYNAAITNLGSGSIEVRLGGIYALQRLMQDSPRDQPTVIAVLCAFVRNQAGPAIMPKQPSAFQPPPASQLPTDIQAALTVVGARDTAKDGTTTVVDFDNAQLPSAQLSNLDLAYANLDGANLDGAFFPNANLKQVALAGANLESTVFVGANLTGANLSSANLTGANLDGANLHGAILDNANLAGAIINNANIDGVDFSSANLNFAQWPQNVPPPKGWVRNPVTYQLSRAKPDA
jgi:hypothetical protein